MKLTPRPENRAAGLKLPRGYRERKLVEPAVCARAGCSSAPADDSCLCVAHRDDHRERNREWAARAAKERKRKRRCRRCGGFRGAAACPRCQVVVGRVPKKALDNKLDNAAARTWLDPDGRKRFHGQLRRGRQTKATTAAQNIVAALKAGQQGLDGLAYAETPAVQERGRVERAGVERAWLSKIHLAMRLFGEVIDEYRYEEELARAAPRPRGKTGSTE